MKLHDRMLIRFQNYVIKNRPNPYIFEYFMIYPKIIEASIATIIGMVFLIFVANLMGEIELNASVLLELAVLIILMIILMIVIVPLLYAVFTSPVLKGLFRDKLSGFPLAAEKMTIEDIFVCGTIDAFQQWDEDVPYIIDKLYPEEYEATPSVLFCRELTEDAIPKSSAKKQCFRFYDDTPFRFDPKKCKHIFWIMTRQKSDLLDRLIELEPTAEFEITYLKHSKILKKIAPIPGWEYADGVAELCEEISNMYP